MTIHPRRRQPWPALPLSLVSLTLALAGCGVAPTPAPPTLRVQAEPLRPRAFSDILDTVSTLEASDEVKLASQAGGRVLRLLAHSGDAVQAGQLLVVLDQTQLRAEVEALRARVERDRLNNARFEQLVRQGAATALQRDEYRATAIASREELRARLADLAYKDLRAPISGVLGDLTIKPGDVLQAGVPFSRIIRNQQLQARIDIPANQAPRLRPGQGVELIQAEGDPVLARGTILSLDPGVTAASQTLLAKARITPTGGQLRNGQRLRTRVLLSQQLRPAVPFSAVSRQSGQAFVFVLGSLGQLRRDPGQSPLARRGDLPANTTVALQRPVRLGALQQGFYPLLSGLDPTERVIQSNSPGLRHGTPVRSVR